MSTGAEDETSWYHGSGLEALQVMEDVGFSWLMMYSKPQNIKVSNCYF